MKVPALEWADDMRRALEQNERREIEELTQRLRDATPGEIVENEDGTRGGVKLSKGDELRLVRGLPHDRPAH